MKRIGEILVENRLITQLQLDAALDAQLKTHRDKRIGEILIDMGYLTYDTLIGYLENQIQSDS